MSKALKSKTRLN